MEARASPLIWCSTCGRDSYTNTCKVCGKIFDKYGERCRKEQQMAKKKSKKSASSKAEVIPEIELTGSIKDYTPDDVVEGVNEDLASFKERGLGDMTDKFRPRMSAIIKRLETLTRDMATYAKVLNKRAEQRAAKKVALQAELEKLN